MAKVRIKYPYTYKKTDFLKTKYTQDGEVEATRTPSFAYRVHNTGLDFMNPVIWRDTKWDWWYISEAETGATLTSVPKNCSRNEAVQYFIECLSCRSETDFQARLEDFRAKPFNHALFVGM